MKICISTMSHSFVKQKPPWQFHHNGNCKLYVTLTGFGMLVCGWSEPLFESSTCYDQSGTNQLSFAFQTGFFPNAL